LKFSLATRDEQRSTDYAMTRDLLNYQY